MIKILILTDDICKWSQNIIEDLSDTMSTIQSRNNSARICNNTFVFQMIDSVVNCKAKKFNTIIIDKNIDKDIIEHILTPMLCVGGIVVNADGCRNICDLSI